MPYPNEHACRLAEPVDGAPTRRANGERSHNGKKYDVIYQEQKGKWIDQAYRYPKETWDADEAGNHCKSHDGKFEAASKEKSQGGIDMKILTREELTSGFPEIVAAIEKEAFEKGVSEGMEKGKLSGAESERERIKGVEEQLIPGHEALIASLKYDGKTTGPEAAVQVLKKERELMASRHSDMVADGEKVKVRDANPPALERVKEEDPAVKLDIIVKEKIKADKSLSYRDALIEAQNENPELAQKIFAEMKAYREKK